MKRDLGDIAGKNFDMLVVGGGVYGICVARDAAMRGLSVALLERGDFGGETSHSSLKLVHGGLRYIQHLDFKRMRQSVVERRAWLRIAPHLVRPLKCVMHTSGHITRGPAALWAAIQVHDLIGYDRSAGLSPARSIPKGFVVGRNRSDELLPGLEDTDHNGAAGWFDGQMQDADRIMIECVASAVASGAVAANYVKVSGLLSDGERVTGVAAEDQITGERFEVHSKVTVNTAGPWADRLKVSKQGASVPVISRQAQNLNMNIVVDRRLSEHAIGVKSTRRSDSKIDSGGRLFFITPWRGLSVIGTTHEAYDGNIESLAFEADHLDAFIDEVNSAYPPARIDRSNVLYCYFGLTPSEDGPSRGEAKRARHGQIINHRDSEGLDGLISVIGVKWTTARLVAMQTVDLAVKLNGFRARPCATADEPLPGGHEFVSAETTEREIKSYAPLLSDDEIADLSMEYGFRWRELLDGLMPASRLEEDEIFQRKVRYAVNQEMAIRLVDVLCRRTSLLQRGRLRQRHKTWSTEFMARCLGWTEERQEFEVAAFDAHCGRMHARVLE